MKNAKLLTAAALAGILSFAATQAIAADKPVEEKCYGVAKSGMNDCHAADHSCAGHTAAADGDKAEWIFMPKGLCEKLVGGSLQAPAAEKAPEMKKDMKTDGKM